MWAFIIVVFLFALFAYISSNNSLKDGKIQQTRYILHNVYSKSSFNFRDKFGYGYSHFPYVDECQPENLTHVFFIKHKDDTKEILYAFEGASKYSFFSIEKIQYEIQNNTDIIKYDCWDVNSRGIFSFPYYDPLDK